MLYLHTENGKFWYILCSFGIFYGFLVYFMVIWYILWFFGIFYGHLVYFMFFGMYCDFWYTFSRFVIHI
jgi:hypothetical protein